MNIVVLVKQVPENLSVGLDRDNGRVRRAEAKGTLDLLSRHAVEAGLALKAAAGGTLTAVAMGPSGADQALKAALAMGCDEAVLVTDPALEGADSLATATVLASAVKGVDGVGLVLAGAASADGATGHVAPMLAEKLGWAYVGGAYAAELAGDRLTASREAASGRERVEAAVPAVVAFTEDAPKPRIPNAMGIMKAAKKPLKAVDLAALGLDGEAAASCTWVSRAYKPEKREKGEALPGTPAEQAEALLARLLRKNLVEV